MNVTENWLDLKIDKYEDGHYYAYEGLTDERCESADWGDILAFVKDLMDGNTAMIAKQEAVK